MYFNTCLAYLEGTIPLRTHFKKKKKKTSEMTHPWFSTRDDVINIIVCSTKKIQWHAVQSNLPWKIVLENLLHTDWHIS